jgi:hypothetical protein
MRIAIDFDGTIVENNFPGIGKEMLFAFETMKELQKQGNQLILWTYRSGEALQDAVDFCKNRGVEFYAVNRNYPEEEYDNTISRKVDADIYIDDKNFGGFPGWPKIWEVLNHSTPDPTVMELRSVLKKKGFLTRIKGLFMTRNRNRLTN